MTTKHYSITSIHDFVSIPYHFLLHFLTLVTLIRDDCLEQNEVTKIATRVSTNKRV